MRNLVFLVMISVLAMAGLSSRALAQVPGGGGRAECDTYIGGHLDSQYSLFATGPGSCTHGADASASIATQPFVLLQATADASGLGGGDRSAAEAIVELQYDFVLTGGTVGDLVPLLVHARMDTSASPSLDANNANIASASVNLLSLACAGCDLVVRNDGHANACTYSPDDTGCTSSFDGDIAFNMASGAGERVFLQIIIAASATSNGRVSASIDPFIFVDPTFAHASDYTVVVDSRVANAIPDLDPGGGTTGVPEPATWALMLAGFGGLGVALRRRRFAAA